MIQSEDVIQYNWIPRLVSSCTKGLRLHLKWSDFPNNQPVRVFFFSPWGPRGSDVSDGPKQCSTRISTNHTLYRSPFGSGSFGFVIVSLSRDSLKGICTGPTCFSKTWTLIPTRSTLSVENLFQRTELYCCRYIFLPWNFIISVSILFFQNA